MSQSRYSRRAREDLRELGRYIARDDPRAASAWIDRIMARIELAAKTPYAGRRFGYRGRQDIREVFVRTYRVVYRVIPNGIVVLAIVEGHRVDIELDID